MPQTSACCSPCSFLVTSWSPKTTLMSLHLRLERQWAAVRTHRSFKSDPPQKGRDPRERQIPTTHGYCPGQGSQPPTIFSSVSSMLIFLTEGLFGPQHFWIIGRLAMTTDIHKRKTNNFMIRLWVNDWPSSTASGESGQRENLFLEANEIGREPVLLT